MKPSQRWRCGTRQLDLGGRPLVLGIVNVTPDSFSDGGQFYDPSQAVEHALSLVAGGADLLDLGGESTRPGATPVDAEEELRRVLPVISRLAKQVSIPISIDTMKPTVARAALDAGACIINDVSGFRDPEMIATAKAANAGVIVMHMPGTPQTMNQDPHYNDLVADVCEYLRQQTDELLNAGIAAEAITIDPGIGFGKFTQHSLELIARLGLFAELGYPVCLGVSRKGFLGRITGREQPSERLAASLAVACYAATQRSAQILRVHDVRETVDALKVLHAIQQTREQIQGC